MVKRLAIALFVSGCSLIVDPHRHVDTDAGADAGEGPTAPVVSIAPDMPHTMDELVASIDVESIDPQNHAFTYEYSWTRDTADAGIAVDRVDPSETSAGEIWEVSVVAVTDDGRRSPPGTDAVTIVNSPPVLRSIGLSTYRPIVDDTLQALTPCGLSDPDGETPRLHYVWRIDGTIVAGATTSRLILVGATPGAEVTLEVHATDAAGASSETVTIGPAIVVTNETRWTQLMPDRAAVTHTIADPERCRVLMVTTYDVETRLWEHDLASDRFVQLRPSGTLGDQNWPVIVNAPNGDTAYLVGTNLIGVDSAPFEITALDMGQRGREAWRSIPISGAPSVTPTILSAIYDDARDVIVFPALGAAGLDIYSVGVNDTDNTLTLEAEGLQSGALASAWVRIPGTRRVLTIGGSDITGGGTGLTPNDLMHELDLDALADGFFERTERLPGPLVIPVAWVDAARDRVVFGLGWDASLTPTSEFYSMDLTTRAITPLDTTNAPSDGTIVGFMVDDGDGGVLLSPGLFGRSTYELFAFDPASDTFRGIFRTSVDAPPPLRMAIGGLIADDFAFYGGRDGEGNAHDTLWRANVTLGSEFRAFAVVEPTPDPTFGAPGPRFGVTFAGEINELVFAGGRTSDTTFADMELWRVTGGGAWSRANVVAGGTPPTPRVGAMIAPSTGFCGGELNFFGGDAGAGPTSDVASFSCPAGSCTWTAETPSGDIRTRSYGGIGSFGPGEVLFIGGEGSGAGGASVYDMCTRTFRTLTIQGEAPPDIEAGIQGDLIFGGVRAFLYEQRILRWTRVDADTIRFDIVPIATDGDGLPPHRSQHVSAYVPDLQALYVYGGWTGTSFFGEIIHADLWVLHVRP